jgi:uncharacterized protein (DUF4213/DUF364 family)
MSKLYDLVLASFDDKAVTNLQIGEAYIGVKIGTRVGVSHRIEDENLSQFNYHQFIGQKVSRLIKSNDPLKNTIATAAINAQITPNKKNVRKGNIFHKILKIAGKYDSIGIIGRFPIIHQLKQLNHNVYAFEQKAIPGFFPADRAEELLPNCDLIIITGTTFVNKTLDHILGLSNGHTLVVGPTTPLSEILFDFGVDVLAGIICEDDNALNVIRQGGSTKELKKFVDTVYISKN